MVATPPAVNGHGWSFTLAIASEADGRVHIERVDVAGGDGTAAVVGELRSAQLVYVEGRLERGLRGALIRARQVMALGEPPQPTEPEPARQGTHASPRPHQRSGHPRRLHAGTPDERVVWVRPARVGEPGRRRRSRRHI